jgi:hypothetical protein
MKRTAPSKTAPSKPTAAAKTPKKKPKPSAKTARPTSRTKGTAKRAAQSSRGVERSNGAKRAAPKPAARVVARRADFGAPIDGFFAKQPPHLRTILETLRQLVEKAVPDAIAALKWGMPVYTIGGVMMCALGGHKAHVNLILAGPPDAFADPERVLTGAGKTGRHLTLRHIDELPRAAVRDWLRKASLLARAKA